MQLSGHPGLVEEFAELAMNRTPVSEVAKIGETEEAGNQKNMALHIIDP